MYVCTHVRTYVYIYIYIYMYMRIYIHKTLGHKVWCLQSVKIILVEVFRELPRITQAELLNHSRKFMVKNVIYAYTFISSTIIIEIRKNHYIA
jgi:hypothetical protein